jgi:hypothetical protein
MRMTNILILAFCGALATGCTKGLQKPSPLIGSAAYAEREPLATSLFSSDQAVMSDEAVSRILSSKVELPAKARVALMKFPDNARRYYWQDQQDARLQESQVNTITEALLASDQIAEAIPLPSLMTPSRVSIPVLREAAVRMQAGQLVAFGSVGKDAELVASVSQ